MRNYKTYLSTLIIVAIFSLKTSATTRKVLFIGNSFIFTNNMPDMMQQLATAMGDTLIYDQNTIGGYTLQQHSTDATTISKIFSQHWDIVVIQEQSQKPAFAPSQVTTDVYPYAHVLDSMVHKNFACSQTMFLMTWGYMNGDASNCASYPPICTYTGMQIRLRESYIQMSIDNAATVAPVGVAWKTVRDSFPALNLYSPDLMHPGVPGSYLEACVMYASVFHKNPLGCIYKAGIADTDAVRLQRIGGRIVFDSMSYWQSHSGYTYSAFNYAIAGKLANFTNTSQNAASYYWTFGDGNNSIGTSPSNTYASNGVYIVKLIASNTCFSELRTDTLHVGTSGVEHTYKSNSNIVVSQSGNGITHFIIRNRSYNKLELYDMTGRMIDTYSLNGNSIVTTKLIPGIYLYKAYGIGTVRNQIEKFVVQ